MIAARRALHALTTLLSVRHSTEPVEIGQWEGLLALAGAHALIPALWIALRDRGAIAALPADVLAVIEDRLPDDRTIPQLVLQQGYEDNSRRNVHLADVGTRVLQQLAAAGIPTLPLKGLHGLLVGLWPDPGVRMMVDLDLLVPEDDATAAFDVLRASAFKELPVALPTGHRHLPMLGHGEVTVELHTEALAARHQPLLPARDLWRDAAPTESGASVCRMSDTHAVTILVAHAQLEDSAFKSFDLPLRALYETSVWSTRPGFDIDWDEIARRFDVVGEQRALSSHLLATHRLFGGGACVKIPSLQVRTRYRLAVVKACVPQLLAGWRYLRRLPRSFSRDRMNELYGPPTGLSWLWVSRARHIARRLGVRVRACLR